MNDLSWERVDVQPFTNPRETKINEVIEKTLFLINQMEHNSSNDNQDGDTETK